MSNLVEFLSKLGSDPALAEAYTKDPETTMTTAGLTDEEKRLMTAGDLEALKQATGYSRLEMNNISIKAYKE